MNERDELNRLRELDRLQQLEAKAAGMGPPDNSGGDSDQADGKGALEFITQLATSAGKSPLDFLQYIGPAVANTLIGMRGLNFSLPQMQTMATLATGTAATIPAGLAGLAQSINPNAPPGAGADTVRNVQESLTYKPTDPMAQFVLGATGEAVDAVRGKLREGGEYVAGPAGGTIAENAPDILGTLFGGRAMLTKARGATALSPAEEAAGIPRGQGLSLAERAPAINAPPPVVPPRPSKEQQRYLALARGEGDQAGAGYRLEREQPWAETSSGGGFDGGGGGRQVATTAGPDGPGQYRVAEDPLQQRILSQGEDPSIVSMVAAAPRQAKRNMLDMLDIVQRGRENKLYTATNRPIDKVGDSLINRIEVVRTANEMAASRLKSVARSLEGKPVDMRPALERLRSLFDDSNINYSIDGDGRLVLDFERSDFRGMGGVQKKIQSVIDEMQSNKVNDAYDWHTFKRAIDTRVSYGKSRGKLPPQAERVLKGLRNAIDQTLDENYPEYKHVNEVYSETISNLNELQDTFGKRVDLTSRAELAQESRKLLSNYAARGPQTRAVAELDRLAKKYSEGASGKGTEIVPAGTLGRISGITAKDLDDGMLSQLEFASHLDGKFNTAGSNSLLGIMSKSNEKLIDGIETAAAARGGVGEAALAGARYAAKKLKGQSEQKYLEAWTDMLKQSSK